MSPEQHQIYMATYTQTLPLLLTRANAMHEAIQQASELALGAVKQYPTELPVPTSRGKAASKEQK